MERFQVIPITPSFQVRVTDQKLKLTPERSRQVDEVWEKSRKENPDRLFNGQLLRALHFDAKEVLGCLVDYKAFYGQHRLASDPQSDSIISIAITGVVHSKHALLMAKRASWVTTDPLLWELAPSGTLSDSCIRGTAADYRQHALDELEEETGISRTLVKQAIPFAIFYDQIKGTLDIALSLEVAVEHPLTFSDEYLEGIWLPFSEIDRFVNSHRSGIAPLTLEILAFLKKLQHWPD